jgi:hypothetical protein
MKSRLSLALLITLGLLASCAHIDPHPMDMTQAERSAKTRADHNALARHYEDAAKAMQARAEAEKKMLAEFQNHAYYYGRQAEDLKEHSEALIRLYEQAADANMRMAKSHQRMAGQAK